MAWLVVTFWGMAHRFVPGAAHRLVPFVWRREFSSVCVSSSATWTLFLRLFRGAAWILSPVTLVVGFPRKVRVNFVYTPAFS